MRRNKIWVEFAVAVAPTVANVFNAINPATSPATIALAVGSIADALLAEHDKRLTTPGTFNKLPNFI